MSVEKTATTLSVLGFLPFAFFITLMLADPGLIPQAAGFNMSAGDFFAFAFKLYAAIILSFVGGIRWGVAIVQQQGGREESEALVLAAGPSIVGWFAFFTPEPWSYAVFAFAYAATGWWDSRLAGNKGVPTWFGRLRVLLSVMVMATMIAAFAASYSTG
jgi:hypothetical protein